MYEICRKGALVTGKPESLIKSSPLNILFKLFVYDEEVEIN